MTGNGGGARACSGGITSRLTLYASITDSRQKHAEWNANEPASVAPRWKPRNQKIDSAIECDQPEERGRRKGARRSGENASRCGGGAGGGARSGRGHHSPSRLHEQQSSSTAPRNVRLTGPLENQCRWIAPIGVSIAGQMARGGGGGVRIVGGKSRKEVER